MLEDAGTFSKSKILSFSLGVQVRSHESWLRTVLTVEICKMGHTDATADAIWFVRSCRIALLATLATRGW